MRKALVFLLILFFSAVFIFAYYSKTIENNSITKIQIDKQKIGTIEHTIFAEGIVLPSNSFPIRVDKDVTIEHVFVNQYEYIKIGDNVVQFSDGTIITSPYEGYVVDFYAQDGTRMYAEDILFSISDSESDLEIQVIIPLEEINNINLQSSAVAEIEQRTHNKIEKTNVSAVIKRIVIAGDYAIVNLTVNSNTNYIIGSTSIVRIGSFSETYYTIVPISSLNQSINNTYVMYTAMEIDGSDGQRFIIHQNVVEILDSNDGYAAISYVVPDTYYIVTYHSKPISNGEEVGLGY